MNHQLDKKESNGLVHLSLYREKQLLVILPQDKDICKAARMIYSQCTDTNNTKHDNYDSTYFCTSDTVPMSSCHSKSKMLASIRG